MRNTSLAKKLLWITILLLGLFAAVGIFGSAYLSQVLRPAFASNDPVIVAAGDIVNCGGQDQSATGEIAAGLTGKVLTLGDNAYPHGSPEEFANCFDHTWGKFKDRIYPTPGNHDYDTPGAAGYFGYFGAAAGEPGKGYYSFDLGAWHLVALNSNCEFIGSCAAGSPQETWLKSDLAAHPAKCTLAFFHHPLFTSGAAEPPTTEMRPIWQDLYDAGVDLVLNGHAHDYERFAPQDPQGNADLARGIVQIVVGTGGIDLAPLQPSPQPNSVVRQNTAYGVLQLTLHPDSYDFKFLPTPRQPFEDAGSGECH